MTGRGEVVRSSVPVLSQRKSDSRPPENVFGRKGTRSCEISSREDLDLAYPVGLIAVLCAAVC